MIPRSTMYAAVDGNHIIQAKGSKRDMRALVKLHPGWYVGNSPSSKVGDTFGTVVGACGKDCCHAQAIYNILHEEEK